MKNGYSLGVLVFFLGVAMLMITRTVAPDDAEPDIEAEEQSVLVAV